ncbi:MAG: STAS domain-containing protein [Shinella sp.]|nr:STAS domain-containing protein [Shinella sp.]
MKLPTMLNIRTVSEVRDTILLSLDNNQNIALEIEDDSQADLSFVQLIEAARVYSRSQGKSLALARPAPAGVMDVLRRGGFVDGISRETVKFWTHQETVR